MGRRRSIRQDLIKKLWRACMEFDLLFPRDRVLVGFSGGKDSAFLLYALAVMRDTGPFPFEVGAVTFDPGFGQPVDFDRLQEYCEELAIPWEGIRTEIGKMALAEGRQNPCARCSYFRRGALISYAKEHSYAKIALGHHQDDAVETFLLSQLYSGQLKTFLPRTELTRSGMTVIRPLVYLRESEVASALRATGFAPQKSPCPLEGKTKRDEVRALIRRLDENHPGVYQNLVAAMREGDHVDLWPRALSKAEMRFKYLRTMHPESSDSGPFSARLNSNQKSDSKASSNGDI